MQWVVWMVILHIARPPSPEWFQHWTLCTIKWHKIMQAGCMPCMDKGLTYFQPYRCSTRRAPKKIAMCLGIKCGAISMFNIQLTSLQRLIPRWCFADSQPKMKAHLNQSFGFQMVWWIVSVATCPAEHQIERHSRMPGHTQNSTSSGQLHPSEISGR